MTRLVVVCAVLAALLFRPDRAEASAHGALGLGSYAEARAPDFGGWAGAEYWPGGLWGARLDAYFLHWTRGGLVEASASRLLGNSRPHLVIAGHLGAGAASPAHAVSLSAGLATTLGLRLGPLALGLDTTVHTLIGAHHFGLLITGVLALEAAF